MAHYVIGDIHGQAALFERLLGEIGFREEKDELCLLGDVIACGQATWPVFERLLSGKSCYLFVMGNHESNLQRNFLPYMTKVRSRREILQPLLALHARCSDKSVLPLLEPLNPTCTANQPADEFAGRISKREMGEEERGAIEQAVIELKMAIGGDAERMHAAYRVLICGLHGFRTFNTYQTLVPEIAGLSDEDYAALGDFINRQPYYRMWTVKGRRYFLIHYLFRRHCEGPDVAHADWFSREAFPELRHMDTRDLDPNYVDLSGFTRPELTDNGVGRDCEVSAPAAFPALLKHSERPDEVCYGHVPVMRWQRETGGNFDPCRILDYRDARGIVYHNLDVVEAGSLAALRLEDGARFYVDDPSIANYEF